MNKHLSRDPLGQLDAALASNDMKEAADILFGLTMWGDNAALAYAATLKCLHSGHRILRSNAIQSLGHIARVFGALDESMKEIIEEALADPDEIIRSQAESAAMDTSGHLKWKFKGWPSEESI
jgi:hypothetical protein